MKYLVSIIGLALTAPAQVQARPVPAKPKLAAAVPVSICSTLTVEQVKNAALDWSSTFRQQSATGLTVVPAGNFLPSTNWRVANARVISVIPDQGTICSANLFYQANFRSGKSNQLELRGLQYQVWTGSDGRMMVATYNWPTDTQMADPLNAVNQALVVNGRTLQQDWDAKRARQPQNVLQAFAQMGAAHNAGVEAYARSQGIPVDQMKAEEAAKTRRYAEPCRRNGGTWGYPTRNGVINGPLGCYYQVVN